MNGYTSEIQRFLGDGGEQSAGRLRALLLDCVGPGERTAKRDIAALVTAFELGITRTPVADWQSVHDRLMADPRVEPVYGEAALATWATALGIDLEAHRAAHPPVDPAVDQLGDGARTLPRAYFLALALGAVLFVVGIVIGRATHYDARNETAFIAIAGLSALAGCAFGLSRSRGARVAIGTLASLLSGICIGLTWFMQGQNDSSASAEVFQLLGLWTTALTCLSAVFVAVYRKSAQSRTAP